MSWNCCGPIKFWLLKTFLKSLKNIGWEKNTTYTVIKRLINKGAIRREDPGFLCSAEVTKKEIQDIETKALLNKMYNGSLSTFINDYLGNRKLSLEETMELKRILHLNE